jgi:hypothetical protein
MNEAFSFRLSAETTRDENLKARPILSLTLATAIRTSVGVLATNEAKSHRLGFVKLTAGGLSDSVTLSRVQTHDKRFDVSPASALHNFVVASTRFGRSRETASPCALPNEWHDDSGNWFRSYGNEDWEFDENGLMRLRLGSINDLPIKETERKYHWALGRRPDDHSGLSDLGF